jgi:hypothetical protein
MTARSGRLYSSGLETISQMTWPGLPRASVVLCLKTGVCERVVEFGPLSPARGRAQTDLPVYMLSTRLPTSLGCGELMWLPLLV